MKEIIKTVEANKPDNTSKINSSSTMNEKEIHKLDSDDLAGFKLSWFTIRTKMMGIISLIIIVAMSSIIFFASYWFRRDMQRLVELNNLETANAIGGKAEADFKRVVSNSRQMVRRKDTGYHQETFFEDNPDIVFVGVAEKNEDNLDFTSKIYNLKFLEKNILEKSAVDKLHALHGSRFLPAFNGATSVENITPGFNLPLIGIAQHLSYKEIIVIYLDAGNFLRLFGGEDNEDKLRESFMVNSSGEVIAHPDKKLILSRTSLVDLEIVSEMLMSVVRNGQKQYTDKNGRKWMGSYARYDFGSFGVVSTAPEEKVFENVARTQNRNILILIAAVFTALLIVFYFSKGMTIPMKRLVQAAREIENGNFRISVKLSRRDEIGMLTSSFIKMARGLDEREKMKDAFGKFVNKEIVEQSLKGELKLGGEKKECVIFFSDLRGFTGMSEGMEPEDVVDYLNEYFTGMVRCINQAGGTVDKFIGDAVMAHWGAVKTSGNDTENAVNAALEMRKTLQKFNQKGKEKRPPAIFGCGINTGPVIAGQIGSEERLEFTVIGDSVNLASRIEGLNKTFGTDILITSQSLEKVKGLYRTVEMSPVSVKGKKASVTVYAVLGRMDDPEAPGTLEELRASTGIQFAEETQSASDNEESKI